MDAVRLCPGFKSEYLVGFVKCSLDSVMFYVVNEKGCLQSEYMSRTMWFR